MKDRDRIVVILNDLMDGYAQYSARIVKLNENIRHQQANLAEIEKNRDELVNARDRMDRLMCMLPPAERKLIGFRMRNKYIGKDKVCKQLSMHPKVYETIWRRAIRMMVIALAQEEGVWEEPTDEGTV